MHQTYFIDIDGTLVPHLSNQELDQRISSSQPFTESLLPGIKEFWCNLDPTDQIVLTTARTENHRQVTERIFQENGLRYNFLIMGLPSGPRTLINDYVDELKAFAINVKRDQGWTLSDK
jgi:hypothetical protein